MRLGIDYGTSHTVAILAWPDGRRRPLHFGSSALLSSAVHAGAAGLRTGQDALRAGLGDPAGLEPNPKRRVDDGEVLLGETAHPVADLIAATLRTVWDEAVRVAGRPPAEVMLTHPADWGPLRQGLLADAARRAGIASPAYLPEPVAAATFFVTETDIDVPLGSHAVVYDLGAGTFDVSLVRRTGEGFEVLATGGLGDVGGLDLDGVVVERVGAALSQTEPAVWRRLNGPADAVELRARHALWSEARGAKETLSRQASAALFVPLLDRDSLVTREEFERDAMPILERTASTMTTIVERAGVEWSQVAAVFLVGGSSRVPLAATLVHRACGIAPTVVEQPELVVAEGAVLAPMPESAGEASSPPLSPALARVLDAAMETVGTVGGAELIERRMALLEFLAAADPVRALETADTLDVADNAVRRAIEDLDLGSPAAHLTFTASLPDGSPAKSSLLIQSAYAAAVGADPGLACRLLPDAARAAQSLPDGAGKVWVLFEVALHLLMAADPGLIERLKSVWNANPSDKDMAEVNALMDALRSHGGADRAEGMRLCGEAERIVRALPDDTAEETGYMFAGLLSLIDPARGANLAMDCANPPPALIASAMAMADVDPGLAKEILTEFEAMVSSLDDDSLWGPTRISVTPIWAAIEPPRAEAMLSSFPAGAEAEWLETLRDSLRVLARTDPAMAERLTFSVPDGERDAVLADLVTALAPRDPGHAERLIAAFTDGEHRARAVGELAKWLVATDLDRAERVAELVAPQDAASRVAIADAIADADPGRAEAVLCSIAADVQDGWHGAERVVEKIAAFDAQGAEAVVIRMPRAERAGPAVHVVAALARKDPEAAERLLRESMAAGDAELVTALAAVAHAFTAKGGGFMSPDRRRGLSLFEEAERAARDGGSAKAGMLAEVAVALAEFDGAHARHLLGEAEAACADLDDARARFTVDLVKAWTPLDIDRAEGLARSIPDTHRAERAEALLTIAQYLHPLGK
ncbi:Hsp70 family protein [Phytomonospora sp. NPDC050363]|uniref:Hsp70 family protein n=1 Tax=Phytomonospora sp. NPDC050363 TaxID=3155642 RepID=UPI0033DC6F42